MGAEYPESALHVPFQAQVLNESRLYRVLDECVEFIVRYTFFVSLGQLFFSASLELERGQTVLDEFVREIAAELVRKITMKDEVARQLLI